MRDAAAVAFGNMFSLRSPRPSRGEGGSAGLALGGAIVAPFVFVFNARLVAYRPRWRPGKGQPRLDGAWPVISG